ncbi:MAG: hypothetical protein Q9170_007655 [Blastenia crenularia]
MPPTARSRDDRCYYQKEHDDGGLILRWEEGGEEHVYDEEVIGVIENPKFRGKKSPTWLLLRVVKSGFSFEALPFEYCSLAGLSPRHRQTFQKVSRPESFLLPTNQDGSLNLHVIVSVCSGVREAQQYFDGVLSKALACLDLDPETYHVHVTESEKSITEITERIILPRANEGTAQTILLLSGDGGIVDIVNTLLLSSRSENYVNPTIGLICMGTGNAIANSTGLNRDATRGLRSIFRGRRHNLPTFTARFSPGSVLLTDEGRKTEPLPSDESDDGVVHGVVVCSWALHASLVADSDTTEYRKYGAQRFQMAAKELMAPVDASAPHVYNGRITLQRSSDSGNSIWEEIQETKTSYIVATLVSNFEEKLCISPHSKPLDGQLRVLRFGDISAADVMRLLGMAFQGGGHEKDEMVQYEPVNGMRIEMDETNGRWRRVCVDGKIIQVEQGGWVEVRKGKEEVVDLVA